MRAPSGDRVRLLELSHEGEVLRRQVNERTRGSVPAGIAPRRTSFFDDPQRQRYLNS